MVHLTAKNETIKHDTNQIILGILKFKKVELILKTRGKIKKTKPSFTHFANKRGGGKPQLLLQPFFHVCVPNKQQNAEISTTFF